MLIQEQNCQIAWGQGCRLVLIIVYHIKVVMDRTYLTQFVGVHKNIDKLFQAITSDALDSVQL